MNSFKAKTDKYIDMIDKQLAEYLKPSSMEYDIVIEAMNYSISAGGKRIRPILTLEFCSMLGEDVKKALPLACAVEMIHCYSLIHDDLPCMDDDDMRRGKPSCHIKFGEANALLAGDGLLTRAFEIIANSPNTHGTDARAALKTVALLSHFAGVDGMIGGQVIDLANEGHVIDADTLKLTHTLKTSALLKAACTLGVAAANGVEKDFNAAVEYAQNLGIAFQIIDDILDVIGDEKQLGKPIGSDSENQKTTYTTLYGLEKSKQLAQEATDLAVNSIQNYAEKAYLTELAFSLINRNN